MERIQDNNNGTITDTATGLMWTKSSYGKNEIGELTVADNSVKPFSQGEATSRFGQAKKIPADSLTWFSGEIRKGQFEKVKSEYLITLDTYNKYKFGNESIEIAGYTDWRLPTIEEFFSLITFNNDKPLEPITCELITPLFGNNIEHLWSANYGGWLNGMQCAWEFQMGKTNGYCSIFGDIGPGSTTHLKFVRAGNIYNQTNLPSKLLQKKTSKRILYSTSPFWMADFKGSFTTEYGISTEEIFVKKSIAGIKYGKRPSMKIENLTRYFPSGTIWGDITFAVDEPGKLNHLRRIKLSIANEVLGSNPSMG